MEKINIAELLKDCPEGMELDCTIYNGKVCFEGIDASNPACPIIKISVNLVHIERLDAWGQYSTRDYSKCVIFPKGKTTWEGFLPPCRFKDGDIVITTLGNIAIIRKHVGEESFCIYGLMVDNNFYRNKVTQVCVKRLATEEEKAKLFDAIKANGYKWNAETKTLEKLIKPKFKVGDKIRERNKHEVFLVSEVCDNHYHLDEKDISLPFLMQDDWELVPNKFDITTLVPFESRVLVRNANNKTWRPTIFGCYRENKYEPFYVLGGTGWKQCIPYEENELLLGTTNDCAEFYKTWE